MSWGDFGGLKALPAMEYECFRMLAAGVACLVGDQMQPRGTLDRTAYQRIGEVYRQVEMVEPWCAGAVPQADVAVLAHDLPRHQHGAPESVPTRLALEGALRVLMESQQQFQIVDAAADFSRYELLVIPDLGRLDAGLAAKVEEFVAGGGALLASHEGPLTESGAPLQCLGVGYEGPLEWETAYLHVDEDVPPDVRAGVGEMDYVVYARGSAVRAAPGTEVAMRVTRPYFDRSWRRFASHAQTPPAEVTDWPAVTFRGRTCYVAFPLFSAYRQYGNAVYQELLANCLRRVHPRPLLRMDAPTGLEASLLTQTAQEDRRVVHLVYGTPQRRALQIDVVRDRAVAVQVGLALRADWPVKRVYLAPQDEDLPFTEQDGYLHVTLPRVVAHQLVVFE